jgi:hypothetical protein
VCRSPIKPCSAMGGVAPPRWPLNATGYNQPYSTATDVVRLRRALLGLRHEHELSLRR